MVASSVAFQPYRQMLRAQLRSQTSYRGSFLIELAASAILTVVDLLTVIVLFRVSGNLGGFTLSTGLLMASIANLGFALASLIVGNVDNLRLGIRTGQLDALLVRPLGLLRQLLATDFELRRFGRVAQSLVAVVIAAVVAHLDWTWRTPLLLLIAPVAASVFFAAVYVIAGSVTFWWIDSGEFANSFTDGGRELVTYPITVYGELFRRLFAFGLGFAFVVYYPVLLLTGRHDPLGLPSFVGWLSPLAAAAAAGVAAIIWRFGVRHYRSTGS
jgi:ABC-2 type transport system permease protein